MKRKKMFITFFTIAIVLFTVYELSKWILGLNSLAYRNIINTFMYVIIAFLTLITIAQLIIALFHKAKQKQLKLSLRVISGIGMALIISATIFVSISGVILGIFTYEPEHVVEKDGEKMVAYVNSFVQVEVNYYNYKNVIVRGSNLKIKEDYGNGGYDPFKRDEMPKVKHYTYYDDNSNVIKSNYGY